MIIKLLFFFNLFVYAVIVSQSFMYIIALRNVKERLEAAFYIELRKLLDENFMAKFKWPMYAGLLLSLALLIFTAQQSIGFLFFSSLLAFLGLLADAVITTKGNLPLNTFIRSWSADQHPADWRMYRSKWLLYFSWRQVANITGFVSLLAGAVFGIS